MDYKATINALRKEQLYHVKQAQKTDDESTGKRSLQIAIFILEATRRIEMALELVCPFATDVASSSLTAIKSPVRRGDSQRPKHESAAVPETTTAKNW